MQTTLPEGLTDLVTGTSLGFCPPAQYCHPTRGLALTSTQPMVHLPYDPDADVLYQPVLQRLWPPCCVYFLGEVPCSHSLTYPLTPMTIHGFCDNSGLIQQVQALQDNKIPNPSQAISNDYDLINKIYQTIKCLPVPVKLQHVKGHQDKAPPPADLPYKAQLNILCDSRARNNLETLPLNLCLHPTLPTAYPHL